MKIKLINIKTNKEEEISEKNIIETLYYNTHKLSKKTTDIKNYISNIETKIP